MADAKQLFDDLAEEQRVRPEVDMGRIRAKKGLTVNGKVYAFVSGDRLIVKVPLERAQAMIADGTAQVVQMGKRRLKEWVAFAELDEQTWRAAMTEAQAYVESLTKT